MWFMLAIGCGLCETERGQLEGCRDYWMGRLSGLMSNSKLRGGSPHPCRLRTDRLAPVDKFKMCTDACEILWGPVNLVASITAWSNRNRYSMVVVGGRMR
jgi:hypothetical protein